MRDVQLTRQCSKPIILFGTGHQIDVSRIKNLPAGATKARIKQRNNAFVFVFFRDMYGVHQFAIQDDGDGFTLVHEQAWNQTQRVSKAEELFRVENGELTGGYPYVSAYRELSTATLDGDFAADELEAIAAWMREPAKEAA